MELLKDIKEKGIKINSAQLETLIRIDYFKEFGKTQKLLSVVKLYDNVATKKQFKKDKLPCGIKEDMFRKYATKETEKMFTKVDV